MKSGWTIKRTNGDDPDFQLLITRLDHELWHELKENQATYDQYNKVPGIPTALVLYMNEIPAAIGCFKKYNDHSVEIKRMFVEKNFRRMGLSLLILTELERWAMELGFTYALLETSIHFTPARSLYTQAGYEVIPNYDQYKGLEESICMKKRLAAESPSEFFDVKGIEYFLFEEDFVEKGIRCIPMIVRYKMDLAGVKLKLAEWNKFSVTDRITLAKKPCRDKTEAEVYRQYLEQLIVDRTGHAATPLRIDINPPWANKHQLPAELESKLEKLSWKIIPEQWSHLTDLQRFALFKLSREGHENKNLPKAMKEFGLLNKS